MKTENIRKIRDIFESFPNIKLAYFFGSRAAGKAGPLSDYDFAVYSSEKNPEKLMKMKFSLMNKLNHFLKTDKIDVVILNLTESPELKYNIIKDGKLILEKEPFKVVVEPKILSEYFDFRQMLLKYGLTKA